MKIVIAIICTTITGVTAFSAREPLSKISFVGLRMSSEETQMEEVPIVVEPPKPKLPEKSESLPFMMRPPALDGSLVGDVGFDPLGFAKTKDDLLNYREAEIKHARLAMLVS
jgi:Chlorophyll A-B binding protein